MRAKKSIRENMQKPGGAARLTDRIREMMDVPPESISPISVAEVKGGREAVVSGWSGVLEYSTETVILRVREGCVRIVGAHLEMQSLIGDQITVCGVITAVHLEGMHKTESGGHSV